MRISVKGAVLFCLIPCALFHNSLCDANPTGIFVYGTLRPDLPALSSYSVEFNEKTRAEPAVLSNFALYFDGWYPYIKPRKAATTLGMIVYPDDMESKLELADQIENEGLLYRRAVITISKEDGSTEEAYTYIKISPTSADVFVGTQWTGTQYVELVAAYLVNSNNLLSYEDALEYSRKADGDLTTAQSFIKWKVRF